MAELKLNHIFKMYDNDVTVVKDFNLHIKDREFIVFVGPSGCGKSTTLRMIAGLEEITEGDLYLNGIRINDVPSKDRDIAMVFQNYALYSHMTVYDNIAFSLKLRKLPKAEIEAKVKETAKMLGLESLLKRKPKSLSGGQRQRVALGRAIVRKPQVFLMDEPLSNLDAKLRMQMRAEIVKLHRRLNTTTIYVTHDQTEAMTMATRLVVMNEGEIQQVGSPKEVYDLPENVFVGGFIGSPSMNFFYGKVEENQFFLGDKKLTIPREKLATLQAKGYLGKEIILGVRPEAFHEDKEFLDAAFTVSVDVVELTGAETVIYSTIENQSLAARLHFRRDLAHGETIRLCIDMNNVHFFDKETERRIR